MCEWTWSSASKTSLICFEQWLQEKLYMDIVYSLPYWLVIDCSAVPICIASISFVYILPTNVVSVYPKVMAQNKELHESSLLLLPLCVESTEISASLHRCTE